MVIFHSYVSLPDGNHPLLAGWMPQERLRRGAAPATGDGRGSGGAALRQDLGRGQGRP